MKGVKSANAEQQSLAREESWEQVQAGELSNNPLRSANINQSQSDRDEAISIPGSSFSFNSVTLQTLFPLQSVADRVTAQVEEFAIQVDEWLLNTDGVNDAGLKHDQTLHLVEGLKSVAEAAVTWLRDDRSAAGGGKIRTPLREHVELLINRSASNSQRLIAAPVNGHSSAPDQEAEVLQNAEAEANTWGLLQRLVDFHFADPRVDVERDKKEFEELRGPITSETPNDEIWERFIFNNSSAREKNVVLSWLEKCVVLDDSELSKAVDKLEAAAGTSRGTWSHGAINTREKLKARKRMLSVTAPFGSSALAARGSDEMVSELDPDAVSRQGQSLERADDIHESWLWVACFILLRQGATWQSVRSFLQERNEAWMAASFGATQNERETRTCVDGPSVGALWRRMCFAASRRPEVYEYEQAVYGLLAGDSSAVESVCFTWDDFVFAHYNALLIAEFEEWVQQECPERMTAAVFHKFPQPNQSAWASDISEFMRRLREQRTTSSEARTCAKLVQASLVSQTFPDFVRDVGITMSKDANRAGPTPIIPQTSAELSEDYYEDLEEFLRDFNAIRLIVHIIIVFEAFNGPMFDDSPADRVFVENVFVYYLNYLRVVKKIEAIPTYARFVSQPRREIAVGVIMLDIEDPKEQDRLVNLMRGSSLYMPDVMAAQIEFAQAKMGLEMDAFDPIHRLDILEPTDKPMWPGQRIRVDFVQSELTEGEARLIRAAEWFMHIRSQWEGTFDALTLVLKSFLMSGHWSAAVEFTRRIPFSDVSKQKSASELGRGIDVFQEQDIEDEAVEEQSFRRTTRASSRQPSLPPSQPRVLDQRTQMIIELLKLQSRQCLEMQQLCIALDKISTWRHDVEAQIPVGGLNNPQTDKLLQSELDELTAAMEPLLRGDFMTAITYGKQLLSRIQCKSMLTPSTEDQKEDYTHILQVYVPPLILAYNTARTYAAHFLGPETILPALELANVVADDANAELQRAFVETGRMGEFVTAMAHTSRCLLNVNQEGERREKVMRAVMAAGAGADGTGAKKKRRVVRKKSGLKRRGWDGQTVDIWDSSRMI